MRGVAVLYTSVTLVSVANKLLNQVTSFYQNPKNDRRLLLGTNVKAKCLILVEHSFVTMRATLRLILRHTNGRIDTVSNCRKNITTDSCWLGWCDRKRPFAKQRSLRQKLSWFCCPSRLCQHWKVSQTRPQQTVSSIFIDFCRPIGNVEFDRMMPRDHLMYNVSAISNLKQNDKELKKL
jgi:hypothetical protein